MSDLATIRARVERKLWDETNAVWSDDVIDEAIWTALDEFSQVFPQTTSEVITLDADGREIDISDLDGLLNVTRVYWPYDSSEETWPPNRVKGFRLEWIAGDPILTFTAIDGDQPQTDDEVKIWYTCRQTIDDLDSETETSLNSLQETLIIIGAAGYAVQGRGLDLLRISEIDPDLVTKYEKWADGRLLEFRAKLEQLRGESARAGESFATPWTLDKWDG
jgi:hypothetical protein